MAPRKRKDSCWLPVRVYRGRASYEFHPKTGGSIKLATIKRNESGVPVEDEAVKMAVLAAHKQALLGNAQRKDMTWLIEQYQASMQFKSLAAKTREGDELRIKNRVLPVFKKMMPADVKKMHIRQYMDKVGKSSPVSANRDHGFLSRLFSWAEERGLIDGNPCQGVRKFREEPRDRYPEDWEYDLVAESAQYTSYPWMVFAMEFAYLCRMRKSEVLALDEDKHILPEGVFVERGKGSANEITAWSPRLRAAYDGIKTLTAGRPTIIGKRWLFKDKKGCRISESAFNSAWRRVRDHAIEAGITIDGVTVKLKEPFNFHDLKAKGVTDHETKASGHRSAKMQAVYDRKPNIINSTR